MCIVVLRTGEPIPEVVETRGQFSRLIRETVGPLWEGEWHEHDVRADAPLPPIAGPAAFVITGSAASVTERAPWMLRAEEYIRAIHAARVPTLGICFGHQLIAQALGGEVQRNPRGREMGTVSVRRVGGASPLLEGLDDTFLVNATHVDSVVRLPDGARLLAATELDPHAVFSVGEAMHAVQFHPEMDGDVMRSYVTARAHALTGEGLCPAAIHAAVVDAPNGSDILRNFVRAFAPFQRRAA